MKWLNSGKLHCATLFAICLQSEAWSCPKPSKPSAVINVIEGLKLTSLLHSHSTKAPCYCFQGMKHCIKLFSTTSSNHLKTSLPTKCFWNSYGVSVSELRSDLGHQGIVYWCEWCDAVCAPWITEHPDTPAPSCQVTWCASLQIWQIWQLAVLSTLGRASAIQLILQLSWWHLSPGVVFECLWHGAQMRWHHSADSGSTGCNFDVCKESYQEGNTMEIYRTINEWDDYDHLMSWYPELPNNLWYSVCSLAVSMHKSISHAGWGRRRKQCCEVTKNRFSDFVFARQRHCVCILMLLNF